MATETQKRVARLIAKKDFHRHSDKLQMLIHDLKMKTFFGRKRVIVKGHACAGHEWNGEYGLETSGTVKCQCGWEEYCSNKRERDHEHLCHKIDELVRQMRVELE